jgi:hypothetical protein
MAWLEKTIKRITRKEHPCDILLSHSFDFPIVASVEDNGSQIKIQLRKGDPADRRTWLKIITLEEAAHLFHDKQRIFDMPIMQLTGAKTFAEFCGILKEHNYYVA